MQMPVGRALIIQRPLASFHLNVAFVWAWQFMFGGAADFSTLSRQNAAIGAVGQSSSRITPQKLDSW
jgi:hypothetical protein